MSKIKVGQVVYGEPGVNRSRYNKEIIEGVITKVGRVYFEVKFSYQSYKFQIKDLMQKTEYAQDYYIYFSKQEILDKEEKAILISDIKLFFGHWGDIPISLEDLRTIKEIINKNNPK
jgi:hypothetical protein